MAEPARSPSVAPSAADAPRLEDPHLEEEVAEQERPGGAAPTGVRIAADVGRADEGAADAGPAEAAKADTADGRPGEPEAAVDQPEAAADGPERNRATAARIAAENVAETVVADARAAASAAAAEARVAAGRAADAASVAARTAASRSARAAQAPLGSLRGELDDARQRLADEQAAWDRVAQASALPELAATDAMSSLAQRLDREAAFWRAFAIDRMRPTVARAMVVAGAAAATIGTTLLAVIGALDALVGSGTSAAHLWAGAGALGVGVLSALACATWLQRASARAADEALTRADRAERKLHRVAAILALAQTGDTERHRDALARFEQG